ncbi:MAG TPA: diaminopimelate decarboxylase [Gammaproteobacteria bacterium]
MDYFDYKNNVLHAEGVDLRAIAKAVGTPCYVYSRKTLERHWHAFNDLFTGLDHLVCYAVKANSSLAVLNVLARLGSGFDIVSAGELERVLKAGGDPGKVVFSGVGKTAAEMRRALDVGIYCFNVESLAELERLNQVAGDMGKPAPVSIRVNPDVDAKTHPYISTGLKQNKFGIDIANALPIYEHASQLPNINVLGVDCHIGSQLSDMNPFVDSVQRLLVLIEALQAKGISLRHVDVGGGLGITYRNEIPPTPQDYAAAILKVLKGQDLKIIMEPGRAIAGNAGILLTEVLYLKPGSEKNFAIVDAAMNDLVRPALYQAWQAIIPVQPRAAGKPVTYDVVGPICETGDFLGKDRELNIASGDLLAIRSAGAYGFAMSSNYNSRPRAAEVMADGDQYYVVRQRETLDDLVKGETVLPSG